MSDGNGTWLEDPEVSKQLDSTIAHLKDNLKFGSDDGERRRIANKIVGNSKFVKSSKRFGLFLWKFFDIKNIP